MHQLHRRVQAGLQAQTLGGSGWADQAQAGVPQLVGGYLIPMQGHAPGGDPRHVEDVVDQFQQVGAVVMDGLGGLGLLGAEGPKEAVPHGLGEAEDAGQGGAQLVAHGRQELILGPGGTGQFGIGAVQFGGAFPDPLGEQGPLPDQGVMSLA